MTYQQQISVTAKGHGEMHDLTEQVAKAVTTSGSKPVPSTFSTWGVRAPSARLNSSRAWSTTSPAILDKLIPPSRNYGHEQAWHDGNGHSRLQATLLGPWLTVPVADGELILGTWQQIFHLECDVRGRRRTVVVTVVRD
jgi:secondary thiamine-phosphate synthase enzyme